MKTLNENQLLGKFVYYSLADVLVDKDDFTRICLSMNFPYAARRISVVDAFRNATGRVTRSITQNSHGSQEISASTAATICAMDRSIRANWCAKLWV